VPASRLDGTSGDPHAQAPPAPPTRHPDGLQKTANQLLLKSYLAIERALDAAAVGWAARRPHSDPGENGAARPAENGGYATFGDVIACYRLLLGRQPDPDGLAHYRQRLGASRVSLDELVSEFLDSVEFARKQAARPVRDGSSGEIVSTCEGFAIRVDPSDYAVGHTVALTGTYEPEVSATLREILREGATFVDIGANIGWFSLLAASLVGPEGRVIAIEPNPRNVALLRQSAKDNGFENVDVAAVALGDRPGAAALETDGSNGRLILVDGPPTQAVEASFVVATYPLDTVLSEVGTGRVDAIKMDVEGAEPLVLRGATRTISESRPLLVSEFYPLALDSSPWGNARRYLAMLRALGYRLSVIGYPGFQDDDEILSFTNEPGAGHVDLLGRPA
jgi:FkbM family methyltransferase